jgi:replicative DNA helicase
MTLDQELAAARAATTTRPQYDLDRVVDGATFLLDDLRVDLVPRWGKSDGEIAWPRGEPLLVVGPTGVGKTTVAAQLIGALLGLRPDVLGLPVEPAERILYLALDRPLQITRALRRTLGQEAFRDALATRLTFWRGPLPADLGRAPQLLADLAHHHGADAVFIDSLKDTAARIADDETGSNVNRAMQRLVADDIDVCALHHQRKGQDGRRPKTLEDVYGSTWLAAGAGSVILLWGDAGSELVDLQHLKQPADPIGPWKLEHDHHTGTTTVVAGFDVLRYLLHQLGGATLGQIAAAQWGGEASEAQRKRTERTLRKLIRQTPPRVLVDGQERGAGAFTAARYYAADAVDASVDTTP